MDRSDKKVCGEKKEARGKDGGSVAGPGAPASDRSGSGWCA